MDALQAKVLIRKMKNLIKWNSQREQLADFYSSKLNNIKDLITPSVKSNSKHAWHLYVIRTQNRDELKEFVQSKGVETGIHYKNSLPFLDAYKHLGWSKKDYPVAAKVQDEILSLPIYPSLKFEEANYVVKKIKKFFK